MSDRRGPAACADKLTPMSATPVSRRAAWFALTVAFTAALVVACGGGGGVGTNGTGSVNFGTVTGFGSVIVDGVRYDDSAAPVQLEDNSTGSSPYALAEVKLGHRTLIEGRNGADDTVTSVATRIELDPSLTGTIDANSLITNRFTVLGQPVEVNNGSNPLVPFTVYDGYVDFSAVHEGDVVEVHAIRQVTAGTTTYYATRVEKQVTNPAFVRIAGLVSNFAGTTVAGTNFQLGTLTVNIADTTQIFPSGAVLKNGDSVVVYADSAVVSLPATSLDAQKIRIRQAATRPDSGYVSGVVSNVEARSGKFDVDGVTVRFGSSLTAPAESSYVRVSATLNADGTYTAARIQVRRSDDDTGSELHGNVSLVTSSSFVVRDTLVQIGSAVISNCGANGLAAALPPYVEVKGVVGSNGVVAKSIKCDDSGASAPSATITRSGAILTLNLANKTFTIDGGLTVVYTANTFFRRMTEQDLTFGASVEVEGTLSGTTLTATKIKLNSPT